jgi:hypothetical protein
MIVVTKIQRMLTSLVVAIPAAFLAFLLVMAMLSHSENLSTMAYIVMGGTLVGMLVTLAIPVGILVGGNRKPASARLVAARQDSGGDIETLDDDVEVSEGSSGSFDEQDVPGDSSDFDLGNSSEEILIDDSEDNIDTEPVDDFDNFDLDEEIEKKSKKKKR